MSSAGESRLKPATSRRVHRARSAAAPAPRLCSLEQALAYRNDQILYKFQERWDVSFEEAAELFEETKKWLWLQVAAWQRPGSPLMAMTVPLAMLDEMLHTFILFTREYIRYCEDHYGVYLHHHPTTKAEKNARREEFRRDRERVLAEETEFLRSMYTFTYEMLGEETVVKWYSEYAEKYSGPRIAELSTIGRRSAHEDEPAAAAPSL